MDDMEWLDEILERTGKLYQDYLDEARIYDGASWGGKKVDEIKQTILAHIKEVELEALEEFRKFCYEEHAFEAWDTPASNRQGWLDTKLRDFAALKTQKDTINQEEDK